MVKIAVADIVQTYRPQFEKWPGLIIDVTEEQIVTDLALAAEITNNLQHLDVKLAIDDFGRSYSSLVRLKELPFAELKLDRAFVTDCGTDKVNAPLCKTVIDLAHSFGSMAVAIGIEKASDALALVSMGCDYGVRDSCSVSRCRRSVSSRCCASAPLRRAGSLPPDAAPMARVGAKQIA